MATSSITKNVIVSGSTQVKRFADAIEDSYQESLHRVPWSNMKITHLRGSEAVRAFMKKRKNTNDE